MGKSNKFGMFAGVFTPSILTILGVIMYMRLGWIVGQAGLLYTIGIIIISHIISISTGLSISSIATDKKIKTGGIYYMLSRSLGFPMGGSIGITIFVGTALSISLYIIGFAESLLGIEAIRNFLHLGTDINSYRILGTFTIIFLVLIAFISTSLAIKAQFYILGAIALSLVSIFVGFFINSDLAPETINLYPSENHVSLELIFAIFFPAVTGFTAGVAMSGDLKNSKKSIPTGTMLAIAVGFIVYIVFAIALAYFIKQDTLINDINFLTKIAWFAPLVVAGIWGATLSSALGGILGAPRILQAISKDKITPKIFAKGYGESNEPRNALLLTFVLAELGILIGELNAIAGIVSMFYLAAYGFINVSYALESWASSDFRPSFRISKYIGIIGFIACFGVMFKLDMLSMIISFIIMGAIYAFLKQKQIKSDLGDVWQSVWNTVIKTALHQVYKKNLEKRNWQANVILFSGGINKRPHLIDFGKFIVGKYGMLSTFDVVKSDKDILFSKQQQNVKHIKELGIFTRKISCSNIYEGIKTVASTYGFSGIEPNTIILGWARQSENPIDFVHLLKNLIQLDLSVLMLDYSHKRGFGNYKTIDLWWRGAGNNGNFALTLVRFIWLSPEWREAKLRLLIINSKNEEKETIFKDTQNILNSLRIDAEIKIINNEIEKKPFEEIIRIESLNTDLIFLGIGDVAEGQEINFVEKMIALLHNIGSVVLIKASSYFKELQVREKKEEKPETTEYPELNKALEHLDNVLLSRLKTYKIDFPKNNMIKNHLTILHQDFKNLAGDFYKNYFSSIMKYKNSYQNELIRLIYKTYNNTNVIVQKNEPLTQQKLIAKIQNNFLIRSRKLIDEVINDALKSQKAILEEATQYFINKLNKEINNSTNFFWDTYNLSDLKPSKNDSLNVRLFKIFHTLKINITGHPSKYKIQFRELLKSHLPEKIYITLFNVINEFGMISVKHILEYQKIVKLVKESLYVLSKDALSGNLDEKIINTQKEKILKELRQLIKITPRAQIKIYYLLIEEMNKKIQLISNDLSLVHPNSLISKNKRSKKKVKFTYNEILNLPKIWKRNQKLFYNATNIELQLFSFENKLRKILTDTSKEIEKAFEKVAIVNLNNLKDYVIFYKGELAKNKTIKFNYQQAKYEQSNYYLSFKEIIEVTFENIKLNINKFPDSIEIMDDNSFNNFNNLQFKEDGIEIINLGFARLLDYLIQSELIEPLQKIIEKLPKDIRYFNSLIQNISREISEYSELEEEQILQADNSIQNFKFFIKKQEKNIFVAIENAEIKKAKITAEINQRLNDTTEKLSLYVFTRTTGDLKEYFKDQESKKRFAVLRKKSLNLKQLFSDSFENLYYRKSETILHTQKMGLYKTKTTISVNELLNFLEQVSPNSLLIQSLPFYYKQLFLNKHQYDRELWVGRKKELLQAKKAFSRYKNGFLGGILVTGERNSGKTFFSQYIAHNICKGGKIYEIDAIRDSHINENLFKEVLENKLNYYGTYEEIFNHIPENSILIFNDIELWWEKSEDGFFIIDKILNFIEKFSNKCFFILNVNIYSFRLMKKIKSIENYFLQVIICSAFSAKELKEIILLRHRSNPLKFLLNNKHENSLTSIDYASLFSKYFECTKGNVGMTLQYWAINIEKFENGLLYIKNPSFPSLEILNYLDADVLILILQFIIHQRLKLENLAKLTLKDMTVLEKQVNYLKRSGVLVEDANKTLTINQYMYFYLREKLIQKEIL